jgi:hypothetical protein
MAANPDELIPCQGRDQAYDDVQAVIEDLEKQLEDALKRLEKKCR